MMKVDFLIGGNIMDDMQFAKYAADIREILEKTDREDLENLVRNVVAYAHRHNNSKTKILGIGLSSMEVTQTQRNSLTDYADGGRSETIILH